MLSHPRNLAVVGHSIFMPEPDHDIFKNEND